MKVSFAAAVGALTLLWSGAAVAERSGQDHNHAAQQNSATQTAISQARALEIAAEQGIAHIHEIELRRGVWKVEGHTAEDRPIEVEIDPQTGAIVKREIY